MAGRDRTFDFTAVVQPGDTIGWNHAGAEPLRLIAQLLEQRAALPPGVGVFLSGVGLSDGVPPEAAEQLRFTGIGGLGTHRRLAQAGRLEVIPCRFSQMPRLIAEGHVRIDVFLTRASLPNRAGEISLGPTLAVALEMMAAARVRIVEVNPNVPWVPGDAVVPLDRFDHVVESDGPLAELPPARPVGPDVAACCHHIASLVPDGATVQMGIGGIAQELPRHLLEKRRLGVHAGILTDGMMALMEAGVVDGTAKEIDAGLAVAGELLGSRQLYAFAEQRPSVALRPTRYVLADDVLSRFGRFVAVNGGLEVDLTGQVNAESMDGQPIGAVGGHPDFMAAGARSADGLAVAALASMTSTGRSRIVPSVDGGVVTTARTDVDAVVTEHGVAWLRGRTLGQRIEALIAVAHPLHRAELWAAAKAW